MKRILVLSLLAMLFLAGGLSLASAAVPEIYVRNAPFLGKVLVSGGEVFVELDAFLVAMKCSWEQVDGEVRIFRKPGPAKPLTQKAGTPSFSLEGRPFSVLQKVSDGTIFVSLKQMAGNLGALVMDNKALGTTDVVVPPKGMSPEAYRKEAQGASARAEMEARADEARKKLEAAKGTPTPAEAAQPAQKESPVKGDVSDYFPPFPDHSNSDTWLRPAVVNTGNVTVKNVVAILHVKDLYGKDIISFTRNIGDMPAGKREKWEQYWRNPSSLNFKLELEIKHDPIEEEKKAEQVPPAPSR